MHETADLAVVGGGSTAISFLAQFVDLLEAAERTGYRRIAVFEPSPDIGPGGPYSTTDLVTNLLNIPAGKMSAHARDRGHFLEWLKAQPESVRRAHGVSRIDPTDFLPRSLFGLYLRDVWHDLLKKAAQLGVEIRHVQEAVESISSPVPGEIRLTTPNREVSAARVVLCNGNLPSATFPQLEGRPHYFNSPYPCTNLVERIPRDATVCVLGTSLSAVDAIVALKSNGHEGPILATSRNGRLPSVRSAAGLSISVPPPTLEQFQAIAERNGGPLRVLDILEVLKERLLATGTVPDPEDVLGSGLHPHEALDREIILAQTTPRMWQCVAISLNEVIDRVWHMLPEAERQRFYSEWRSLWMVRRATFPLVNATKIQQYVHAGALAIAPNFLSCDPAADSDGYVIQVLDESGNRQAHAVDYVVNATSFSVDVAQSTDPLIASLLRNGLASPDPYGGLRMDPATGCLRDARGDLVPEVSLLGSLATGTYFWTVSLDVNSRLALEQAQRLVREGALLTNPVA